MRFLPSLPRPGISLLPLTVAALFINLGAELAAQTARPGSANRGVSRAGTTTARGVGGGQGINSGPRQYRSNTMLGDAMIEVDPETRSLVIVTDEETHGEMTKVIRDLDRPKPQVLIKVVFVEVTWNKGLDLGVEGSYTFNLENPVGALTGTRNTTSTVTGSNGSTTTTNTSQDLGVAARAAESAGLQSLFGLASATDGTFLRFVTDDWSATLRAIATRGKVEVLSRPSIMARNNQEAVIVVGQEVPFITNSRITDDGQTINTIQYDNVGIILRVTPFINSNNTVEMIVAPEISSLTAQTVPISNNASAPVIAKRSAETVVVTPNGSTAVIGGLMETQRIETVRKIPLLGDIPVLGFPFRRTVKEDVKRELMIFLTPCIINDPGQTETLASQELDGTELVSQAFSEQEFEKFFQADCPPEETAGGKTVTPVPQIRKAIPVTRTKTKTTTTTTRTAAPAIIPAASTRRR